MKGENLMKKLLAENVIEVMQDCNEKALKGFPSAAVFKNGKQNLIFIGKLLDVSFKSNFAACDVFLEEDGKRKVLYSVSSLKNASSAPADNTIKSVKEFVSKAEFIRS